MAKKTDLKSQHRKFVSDAKEFGLDTDEAEAAFEQAFGKIAPPKKKPDKGATKEPKSDKDAAH